MPQPDSRALLLPQNSNTPIGRRAHRQRHCLPPSNPLHHLPSAPPVDTDSDTDTLQPMLRQYSEDEDSNSTPSHARYYVGSSGGDVPLTPRLSSVRTSSTSDDYENVYYVGGQGNYSGRPPTPQERGLPPLPSRSDRFRIYFSSERGHGQHQRLRPARHPDGGVSDTYIPFSPQRHRNSDFDTSHLYENLP